MTGRYSRVTLDGDGGRIDVAVPSDVPVGILLPDVLQLVGGRPDGHAVPRRLVTAAGAPLDGTDTLDGARVLDGSLLRLVRVDDVPPAPVVHDVTEAVSENLDVRAWRWGPPARRWTATGVFVAVLVSVASLVRGAAGGSDAVVALAGLAATLIVAAATGRPARRPPAGRRAGHRRRDGGRAGRLERGRRARLAAGGPMGGGGRGRGRGPARARRVVVTRSRGSRGRRRDAGPRRRLGGRGGAAVGHRRAGDADVRRVDRGARPAAPTRAALSRD